MLYQPATTVVQYIIHMGLRVAANICPKLVVYFLHFVFSYEYTRKVSMKLRRKIRMKIAYVDYENDTHK